MKELIRISDSQDTFKVSARELHSVLEKDQKHYGDWIKKFITNNPLAIENTDYQQIREIGIRKKGRPMLPDFTLNIEFAKKLAMLTKNERGETARKYFITCEEKLKEAITGTQIPIQSNIPDLTKMLPQALRELAGRIEQIEIMKPKVDGYNQFLNIPDKAISIKEAARLLNVYRLDKPKELIGQNTLYKYLRYNNILQNNNLPYQKYAQYFMVKQIIKIAEINGKPETLAIPMTFITNKGLERLRLKMVKDGFKFNEEKLMLT